MKNAALIITIICLLAFELNAQETLLTESDTDIYWQPDVQIEFSDYQSPNNEACLKYYEEYGLLTSSSIGFRGVVDIPKKKKKPDKFYLTPVFCKDCSCLLAEDSLSLKVDRLLFDVAVICVRGARRELLELQKEVNANNTYTTFFTTVKNEWDELMRDFFG